MVASGLPCPIVSAGGTGSYIYTIKVPGVTEIQAGGGVFMDLLCVPIAALCVCVCVCVCARFATSQSSMHDHNKCIDIIITSWRLSHSHSNVDFSDFVQNHFCFCFFCAFSG